MAASAIPIVDFQKYGLNVTDPKSVTSDVLETTAEEIYDAFSTIGFLYLINHGIEQRKVDAMFAVSKSFFDQPMEEKMKFLQNHQDCFHGYIALESENLTQAWLADLPEFKSTTFPFFDDVIQLSERVLDVLSIGLKLQDRNFLRDCHRQMGRKGNTTTLRSNYYPPLTGPVKPGQARFGQHTDYGTITLLFQDDIGGLEVMNTDDVYVPAKPIPGAIVVIIGDLMQRWTADQLKATKHRVLIPESEVKKRQYRQSLAFFVNPDDDTIIKSLDGSDKYDPILTLDYLQREFIQMY
ncbi:2-oxoglutarate-Fe(II) type oxidoreductase ppzD-like isoform X2 [Haliotis rubra]|uniref:2-oxoglutarate-Fe(II) type oxidoreductase ppzD-like isoform X2 n=1 Tax=Haliotis rubra TaxID=36100 RepID=UPI001EE606E0|nr:2-oxoglutarate-Fe(II) type oxidoreductase ppzD-like isoform X2 [Haliotis rubra]